MAKFATFLLLALCLRSAESHGYLKSPRSRNFVAYQDGVWSGGTASTYPKESCPHCLNIGGTAGQCGVTGSRSYDDNLNVFGQPMSPALQAQYEQGSVIAVDIVLTAHHKGHFEFFACPIEVGGKAAGNCFEQYPLTFVSDELYGAPKDVNYPERAYIAPPFRTVYDNTGVAGQFFRYRFKLPSNLTGSLVLLQWHYFTANSCKYPGYTEYPFPSDWGDMQDNLGICTNIPADGNGFPEQFWNCAEVSISGSPLPPTSPAPIPAPSAPVPTPTYPTLPMPTASPVPPTTGGTCGNGSIGNGVCAMALLCCSQWGWCGAGSDYCAGNPVVPPTMMPTTHAPTKSPTLVVATNAPTRAPTRVPTAAVTSKAPTRAPTVKITTNAPTRAPTVKITSKAPTRAPTLAITSKAPTRAPTVAITSTAPTRAPTAAITTQAPTHAPTTTQTVHVGTCGNGFVGNGLCSDASLCCSQWGWCGTGTDFCGGNSVLTGGTCGGGVVGNNICPGSLECCSVWGYCGTGPGFCP